MMENSVVFPAPFGPISAVMRPGGAVSDAPSTAFRPPNQQLTRSTASIGSTMLHPWRRLAAAEEPPRVGNPADHPTRHDPDHQHEHGAVDDEIEAGRIANQQPGCLPKRLDDQSAGQGPKDRADAADDGREQRLDRDPGPVSNSGVDE